MVYLKDQANLLKPNSVKFISVNPNNTLEENAKELTTPTTCVLRHVFLKTNSTVTLAIVPFDEIINFKQLELSNDHPTRLISHKGICRSHTDNNTKQLLSANPFKTDTVLIALTVQSYEFVIVESDKAGILMKITPEELLMLVGECEYRSFTETPHSIQLDPHYPTNKTPFTPDNEKKRHLERLYKLPAMPQMANELILLKNNDKAETGDLAALIEKDPSLSAQIIRHSKSAFFNYQGDINSISDAITRVLGFDFAINIALGLSLGKKLKNPVDGPLGLTAFWKHAIYSATLAQTLSRHLPKNTRTKPDLTYLCGLLHNIGFLLLGHLFQPEFFLLNRLYAANLTRSINSIEKHALGMGIGQNAMNMGHAELGAWLLEKWKLPDEVIIVAREHHTMGYSGNHSTYCTLITLVNNALGLHDLGDHREESLNEDLCVRLGISSSVVLEELEALMQASRDMDLAIKQFAG